MQPLPIPSKLTKSATRWCLPLAIVLLLTGNLRFSSSRSASITDYLHLQYNAVSELISSHDNFPLSGSFFLIPTPEMTDWILGNHSEQAFDYYERSLNEDQAELWLYRSYQNHPSRTMNPKEADMFIICGCLHLNYHLKKIGGSVLSPKAYANDVVLSRVLDTSKPHLIAIPTTNPGTSRHIGVKAIVKALTSAGVQDLWSLGFERNEWWQGVPPERIIPIPYVVKKPPEDHSQTFTDFAHNRTDNFVFYAGDRRQHAMEWSGCDRTMVTPLMQEPNMDIRLTYNDRRQSHNVTSHRLSQQDYNHRMRTSEICLILCGDSPTSRSLTSAMVYGCIPLQIGSRWRGLCEPPCHKGWGWTISGIDNPHLPFTNRIEWDIFPELNEADFAKDPVTTLRNQLATTSQDEREAMRTIMRRHRQAFIYGWGNPVHATQFGQAADYALESVWEALNRRQTSTK